MKMRFVNLSLFLFTVAVVNAQSNASTTNNVVDSYKLESEQSKGILANATIPRIMFANESISNVVSFLQQQICDFEKTTSIGSNNWVHLQLRGGTPPEPNADPFNTNGTFIASCSPITYMATNISALHAISVITEMCNFQFMIKGKRVIIFQTPYDWYSKGHLPNEPPPLPPPPTNHPADGKR